VHGGRINMNNEKEFKISNEDISINLSEDEKKMNINNLDCQE